MELAHRWQAISIQGKPLSNTIFSFFPFFYLYIITEMAIDDISQNRRSFNQFTSHEHYVAIVKLMAVY